MIRYFTRFTKKTVGIKFHLNDFDYESVISQE